MSEKYNIPEENPSDSMGGIEKNIEYVESNSSIDIIKDKKEDLRRKYPIDIIISQLGKKDFLIEEYRDLILKRYENCIDCASEISLLYKSSAITEPNWIRSAEFPMNLIERIAKIDKNGKLDSPFIIKNKPPTSEAGILGREAIKEFEKVLEFSPHIIVPAPKSAILPAIIVKEFFDYYKKNDSSFIKPFFTIPKFKIWWSPSEDPGIRETVTAENEYFGNIFSALTKFADKKEIRVIVMDHYVESGFNIDGYVDAVKYVFEGAKDKKNIPSETELKIEKMDLGNVNLHGNAQGFIDTHGYYDVTKSGTSSEHHQRIRKLFSIFGKYFAKEIDLIKDISTSQDNKNAREGSN